MLEFQPFVRCSRLFSHLAALLFSCVLAMFSLPAYAASNPLVTPGINPWQFARELFQTKPAPPQQVVESAAMPEAPQREIPHAERFKFRINHISIRGNTVYQPQVLLNLFRHHMGDVVSLADLQRYAAELTQKYRNDGFVLTRVVLPAQSITGGNITVQVIEGFVDQVSVEGSARTTPLLYQYAEHIKAIRPVNIREIERYLLLANDIPGMQVRAIVQPSKRARGAADIILVAEQKKYDRFLAFDNRGTRYIGPYEMAAGFTMHGFFRPEMSETIRLITSSNGRELRYVNLHHEQPFGSSGLHFKMDGEFTQTRPSGDLDVLKMIGESLSFSADIKYPMVRTRRSNLYFHSGVNYLNNTSRIFNGQMQLFNDRTRSLVLGTAFDYVDGFRGWNSATLDVAQGFNIFGQTRSLADLSRTNGRPAFTKFNAEVTRDQTITDRLSLMLGVKAQYALNPLLVAQQFGFGGQSYGRGFNPSELTGDQGAAGKMELRYNVMPEGYDFCKALQYYTFYEGGSVWSKDVLNVVSHQSATSLGLGARVNFNQYFSGVFELAQPLSRGVAANRFTKAPRFFFTLVANV